MIVLKFGGTSVADAKRIRQISGIIGQYEGSKKLAIVVSALSGVTNMLEECGKQALQNQKKYIDLIKEIEDRHFEIINQLVDPKNRSEIAAHIQLLCNEAEDICQGISILNEYSDRSKAKLLSLGERMSAGVISSALNHLGHRNHLLDTRNLIITDSNYLSGRVNHPVSEKNTVTAFKDIEGIAIVPGFISKNELSEPTTLGRGGSDFTAALLANYLEAEQIDIWTDVNGMLTASPKIVSSAYTIPALSYEEAMELSHFGAKVIYPPTIQPALEKKIPIRIKNTFEPGHEGTLIGPNPVGNGHNVKGFSSIDNISLITVSGSGMVGVQGIAMRVFKAMSLANVNVMFITQSSSEHTICIGVESQRAKEACRFIDEEFENEILRQKVNRATYEDKLTIVAMVGDKMKESIGLAGRAFKLLGDNGVNIRAIAQGGTERNISMVIADKDTKKALNVLHDGFFLSKYRKIHLYNIGVGTVGGTMLEQLKEQASFLKEEYAIDIKLAGVANSKKMLFNAKGIALDNWKFDLLSQGESMNINGFIQKIKELNLRNSIFIDNTASQDITAIYKQIAEMNIPIVASNKIMASSPLEQVSEFKKEVKKRGLKFLHETNVAAGLPVLKTIEDLVASGDKILKIQAVLSGSLNFIFNTISEKVTFSEAVIQAREKGLTEPDPSIDLSGLDVRRKILILARTSGYQLELDDVAKNEIIPEKELKAASFEDLLKNLTKNNAAVENLRVKASKEGKKLRYVAEFDNGKAVTGLQSVDVNHPAYHLDGMDNIILLYTRRYHEQPLVVKGAGAGPGVTASGVFADVMRLANR
ncbi:MAG: bifunctional aspartate kinase/homoserine dehydrogenase I [Salinivirgaceae bacterium]|nr:bifunctional aspartate kinase/homoserine dehydrogenase I [Salinivirgaceae bacterium]